MITYPIVQEGAPPIAFEGDHVYLSRRTIVRLLTTVEGVTEVHLGGRFGSSDDIRIEFKCQGHEYIVMEPFGDNSRYWIGPKGGKDDVPAAANIGKIRNVFERYKPPLPVKLLGDLASLNFKELFPFLMRTHILWSRRTGPESVPREGEAGITAPAPRSSNAAPSSFSPPRPDTR